MLIKYVAPTFLAATLFSSFVSHAAGLQQTDVYVSGNDGYKSYRIPALMVAADRTVLAFCEGRKNSASDTGDIDILLKRSKDGGQTWSQQQVIWDDGSNTCGNPCPVLDESSGTIFLLLTHNLGTDTEDQIKASKAQNTRTVWVSQSTDHGQTWSKPKQITKSVKERDWGWYATGPGVGIQLKQGAHKGRLVIPCDHSFGKPAEKGSHVIYSDNHGRSWKLGGVIRPEMNECQLVEQADGTLLMNMRSYFGRSCRAVSFSRDGGSTWTAPADAPELVEPVCQASIIRATWPTDGTKSEIIFSNPADPKKRRNMTVRLSYDEGKSWPVSKTIWAGPSAYSCLTVLPDKTIGCLYECGEKTSTDHISLARFTTEWLAEAEKK